MRLMCRCLDSATDGQPKPPQIYQTTRQPGQICKYPLARTFSCMVLYHFLIPPSNEMFIAGLFLTSLLATRVEGQCNRAADCIGKTILFKRFVI